MQTANSTLTDEAVVERVRAGDVALFEILMRRHNQRIFRAARAIVKNDDLAEEVMQEAYVSAFEHLDDFGGRARFSTWLTRIAVHASLRRVRLGKRVELTDDIEALEASSGMSRSIDPEQAATDRQIALAIEHAIDELPEAFRIVFMLRGVEQLTVAETAETLGIAEETVRTRFHRAKAAIQGRLLARTDFLTPEVHGFHLSRCDRVVFAVLAKIRGGEPH
ncbi:MAG: RNA polymerase sigma factor [Polyangiaceae bacterium]|nr:RNA polymerase sigma factor [Polyangiaceae bacterium]